MSQENVETVREAMEATFQRPRPDYDTVNRLYEPDHELVTLTGALEGTSGEGVEGFRGWLRRMDEIGDHYRALIDDLQQLPDGRVLVIIRFELQSRRGGPPMDIRGGAVVSVRDGKIFRTEVYSASKDALEAVGLRE